MDKGNFSVFDMCQEPILHENAYQNPNMVAWLLQRSPTFHNKTVPSVRDAYVDTVVSVMPDPVDAEKRQKIRERLAMLNWINPICVRCHKKAPGTWYVPCQECYLYLYCGPECRSLHAEEHRAYCGRRDAPADPQDPCRPAIAHVDRKQQ